MFKSVMKDKEFRYAIRGMAYMLVGWLCFVFLFIVGGFLEKVFPTWGEVIIAIPGAFIVYTLGEAIINKIKSLINVLKNGS